MRSRSAIASTSIPEMVADTTCLVGEGPLWHVDEQRLYWVDILPGLLYRFDPSTGGHERVLDAGEAIGGYTIQTDGSLALFLNRGAVKIWQNGELSTVLEDIPDERDCRFNDVIADPEGRVFCGTMPKNDRLGRLYRLDPDGALSVVLDDIDVSNGLGFTRDLTGLYYTESNKRTIYRFDYDRATGELSNQRVFITTPEQGGVPDGMAVDANDDVWSARWDGNALYRYNRDGVETARVDFPAKKVSSLTFGGPDYADAYVTTAGGGNRPEAGPGAGALFRVNLGVKGKPPFRSRLGLK